MINRGNNFMYLILFENTDLAIQNHRFDGAASAPTPAGKTLRSNNFLSGTTYRTS